MITPAQQKRIDQKLARQEQIRKEDENRRIAEEKQVSEETQRQQAIVRFTQKCYGMGDFQFSHHSIQRVMEFNDFGDGYGEFYFSCDDKPVVGFTDIKRMSELLGTENISIKTNCVLISMDDDDSYKKVYTLCVEVGYI